jgi:hypothetical protein
VVSSSSKKSSSTGAIAGGVVGGIAAISIALAAIFFYRRRRSRPPPAVSADVMESKPLPFSKDEGTTAPSSPSGSPVTMKFYVRVVCVPHCACVSSRAISFPISVHLGPK